jgi:membrane protein DedA with SNARE-associated domain
MTGEAAAALAIALSSLVSEDAAVVGAGLLAFAGTIGWPTAFGAAFLGVWVGDIGLYAVGRWWGRGLAERLLRGSALAAPRLRRSEEWFRRHGWLALVMCRMVPGTRLPTYLTAGLLRMPVAAFVVLTGVLAAGWVLALLFVVAQIGEHAPAFLAQQRWPVAAVVLAVLAAAIIWLRRRPLVETLRRWRQWEFWPAPIFYLPVALWYLLLSLRHRGTMIPTCANPGMYTGGLIGESKMATLRDIEDRHAEWVAASFLVGPGTAGARASALDEGMRVRGLSFPVVLKPDVGQRGSGFRIVHTAAAAAAHLETNPEPLIAQEFLPGPEEAGIFYRRFPHEERGRILSITVKVFPTLTGDGARTIGQLINDDARAGLIAGVYRQRLGARLGEVPARGETVRLVSAGNHAQGCIFRDGAEFITPALEERIDEISRAVPGFFVGRYDVRFPSYADLARGEAFKILELNGAASESTNAYDARHTLIRAYAILFEQWRIVFAIGAANMSRGHRPTPLRRVIREWLAYRRLEVRRGHAD